MVAAAQFGIFLFRLLYKDVHIEVHKTSIPVVFYGCETWIFP